MVSLGEKVVLFGGSDGTNLLNDIWEWDGSNWTQKITSNSPSARSDHAMVSLGEKVVMFGGDVLYGGDDEDGDFIFVANDTWEWDGSNWTQKITSNNASIRSKTAMVSLSEKVVLLGGHGNGTYYKDT